MQTNDFNKSTLANKTKVLLICIFIIMCGKHVGKHFSVSRSFQYIKI